MNFNHFFMCGVPGGIDYALLDTATPFDKALAHYLVQRKKIG